MKIPDKILEEMFDGWLWTKYWDDLEKKAIIEVEKEEGFLKSMFGRGIKQKIKDRHWKLHEELKIELLQELECVKEDGGESK